MNSEGGKEKNNSKKREETEIKVQIHKTGNEVKIIESIGRFWKLTK